MFNIILNSSVSIFSLLIFGGSFYWCRTRTNGMRQYYLTLDHILHVTKYGRHVIIQKMMEVFN